MGAVLGMGGTALPDRGHQTSKTSKGTGLAVGGTSTQTRGVMSTGPRLHSRSYMRIRGQSWALTELTFLLFSDTSIFIILISKALTCLNRK